MRFELAMAFNMLYHSRALEEGRGRIFSNTESKVIRKMLCPFLAGTRTLTYLERTTVYYMLRGYDLPFKLSEPKATDCPSTAVDFEHRIMLFFVPTKDMPLRAWQKHLKHLTGVTQETFSFGNGDKLTYTSVAQNFANISYLKVIGFKVYSEYKQVQNLPDVKASDLDPRLFPYQVKGVQMFEAGFRLMADEQGLGKTAQTLQFLQRRNPERVLICCPATLKFNWKREILMWTHYKENEISILSGATPYRVTTRFSIINYDILPYWEKSLSKERYSFIVCDECHYIQNDSAQRTRAFLSIAQNADDVIFISGTPFTSRPFQMYTALHTIAPKVFKSQRDYGERFCCPQIERGKTVYKGASNMDVLHSILMDGICIRRLKEDVLSELPSKRRLTVSVATDNAELRADRETFGQIRALERKIAESSDVLGTLEWQKQIAYLRKRKAVNAWIEDFLQSGKKLVVFGTHTVTLDDIMAKFGDVAVRVDGSTSQKKRNEAIDAFQHDPNVKLFVGNMRAAGVGITLTAASDALIVEFPWTYSDCAQAEDRVHRIGAKDSVTIWYMCCPDSIDERLMEIINQKAGMHTHIFDGEEDNMMLQLRKDGGFLYHSVFADEGEKIS